MRKKEIRETIRNTFLASIIFLLIISIYRLRNPYVLPGFTERTIATISILFVLLVILYIDVKEIEWKRRILYRNLRRFFLGNKLIYNFFWFRRRTIFFYHPSTADLINWVFQGLLLIYLLLLLIQQYISFTLINLNYVLLAVFIFGISSVFFERDTLPEVRAPTRKDNIFGLFLGVIGAVLIFIKTSELGWPAYLISGFAGILIVLLSFLVLEEDES